MSEKRSFADFLHDGWEKGGFETDDVLAAMLPLMEQARDAHERNLVALSEGISGVWAEGGCLRLDPSAFKPPRSNTSRVTQIQKPEGGGVEVVGESSRVAEIGEGAVVTRNLRVAEADQPVEKPVYVPGYRSWEDLVEHHDPLTDVFLLGLMTAALATGLDLSERSDLERFADQRSNLFALNPRLNPVLAAMILQMTELDRQRRAPDLRAVISRLRNYREQAADQVLDFTSLKGFREGTRAEKRRIIQGHLRNRLFEISRRNRLIHFRSTLQTLNLTLASVPLLLDYRNIRGDQLFIWHDSLARQLSNGSTITLGNYLRFEDAPYASGVLDQIIAEARRDRAEFGFAQLRLVLCFLRWHNLKETPEERIHSPLLLLPVELTKKKGVRDSYQLRPTGTEAEVNPALRHHLHQLYGLKLPEWVDLSEVTLASFHETLRAQIVASEPGVTLECVTKPRIRLIHEKARQRLDQYRRRLRRGGWGAANFGTIDYSYAKDDMRPLGLQLFLRKVRVTPAALSTAMGQKAEARAPGMVAEPSTDGPMKEAESRRYSIEESSDANPYQWEFDLCSLTLGNFNYRKMSLVQDYTRLIEGDSESRVFDSIFSLEPRPAAVGDPTLPPAEEQYPVIACDPTQATAVARARTGASYIIQGPPGTGKSQTITNLIADFVARGKRVLFVCEKRAAIDVVFHRLKQQGLADLCCLIHDSQADKKAFIQDLKHTYELFLQDTDSTADAKRRDLIHRMEEDITGVRRFAEAMGHVHETAGVRLRDLLQRLVELRPHETTLTPLDFERVPDYALWREHGGVLLRMEQTLKELGLEPLLARHPFRLLNREVLESPNPMEVITAGVERALKILGQVETSLAPTSLPVEMRARLEQIESVLRFAQAIRPLGEWNLLFLLDADHDRTKVFARAQKKLRALEKKCAEAAKATGGWREKLPSREVAAALQQARSFADSWFAFLNPAWWRLRKILHQRYDFGRHVVKPAWVQILGELQAEFDTAQTHEDGLRELQEEFEIPDARECLAFVASLPAIVEGLEESARALQEHVAQNPSDARLVSSLATLHDVFVRLDAELSKFLGDYRDHLVQELSGHLREIAARVPTLPELAPILSEVHGLPPPLGRAARRLPLTNAQLESAMGRKSLDSVYRQQRDLRSLDGPSLQRRLDRFERHHREWLKLNAAWILEQVRTRVLENVRVSSLPAAQLTNEQKAFKKTYSTGRRELEHEFEKTMRYRSIRDLADDETGVVVRDLKPIWLMSPLSVSDTIPLDSGSFDVVIFDEASQIPVEEAVPALYRARQTIVVGDDKQLPPTNFFSATRADEDSLMIEEDGEKIEYDLDADSFLTQSARNLPSTMLGWHYRSRHESLISFSNAAFYEGRLLTVPDLLAHGTAREELRVASPDQGGANADQLLDRTLSFHFMENGLYEDRRNAPEARYIAQMVRGLFRRGVKHSIGIVAFSEAQQGEIESALTQLGVEDDEFRLRLEAEYEREEDNQFCGLFVKNLENVQGDERDIVILSICYGYDRNKKMLMNFGPINQRGGERRLNVIFSRAKHRMAVVSSIHHNDITNEYNDGANCLRNFLEYSAASSRGDAITARRVLASWHRERGASDAAGTGAVIRELSEALRARGHGVDADVGQSEFRCALAVRDPSRPEYRLGILVDAHAQTPHSVLEHYVLRPGVLRAFGWKTTLVLAKDWYHDRDAVLQRLERLLRGDPDEPAETDEALEETPPAPPPAASEPKPRVEEPKVESVPSSAPAPLPVATAAPVATGVARYFEFKDDKSSKFWEVVVNGNEFTVRFGRIGTQGQSQTKIAASGADAEREATKLVREKLGKGYVEGQGR